MLINGLKSYNVNKYDSAAKTSNIQPKTNCGEAQNVVQKNVSASAYRANFASHVNFGGNAKVIKNAFRITATGDKPIEVNNGNYIVDKECGATITYGEDAVRYLNNNDYFKYDTQVVFPKNSSGSVITENGKEIELKENSAVMINAGTKLKVNVKNGYPLIVSTKQDYEWYDRYSQNARTERVSDKYFELSDINTHLFNGAFSTDFLVPDSLKTDELWNEKTGLKRPKWAGRNRMLDILNENKDVLNPEQRAELEKTNKFVAKLFKAKIIQQEEDRKPHKDKNAEWTEPPYVKFRYNYAPDFQRKLLLKSGLNEEEIEILMPIFEKMRLSKQDGFAVRRDIAEPYGDELIQKLKDKGFLFDAKKDDGYVYWKETTDSEKLLDQMLTEADFTLSERKKIIKEYKAQHKSGFDLTGHKYSDKNIAIYSLDDKFNNWTLGATNWVTNSTAMSSSDGKTQSMGVSLVQYDNREIVNMKDIRSEEHLHKHPNSHDKKQSEIYLITSGKAALNIVQNGKSQIKVLNEGDLAIVEPGVEHCVTSLKGEYEHLCVQVPSTFQYGFGFKELAEQPEGTTAEMLIEEAHAKLEKENISWKELSYEYNKNTDAKYTKIFFIPQIEEIKYQLDCNYKKQ